MRILTLEQFNYNLKIIGARHERKGICTVFNPSREYRALNLNHALGNQPEAAQNNINYKFLRELRLIGCRLILADDKDSFTHPILEPMHNYGIDQVLFRNKEYLERDVPELKMIQSREVCIKDDIFNAMVSTAEDKDKLVSQLGYLDDDLTFHVAKKIAQVILDLGINEYRFSK